MTLQASDWRVGARKQSHVGQFPTRCSTPSRGESRSLFRKPCAPNLLVVIRPTVDTYRTSRFQGSGPSGNSYNRQYGVLRLAKALQKNRAPRSTSCCPSTGHGPVNAGRNDEGVVPPYQGGHDDRERPRHWTGVTGVASGPSRRTPLVVSRLRPVFGDCQSIAEISNPLLNSELAHFELVNRIPLYQL